ncbi:SDR family NAD(P)-dependent oxidoreductase [Aeromicrobium sp. REDSEA-S38_B2]|jgi:NAD(P)-dependent dehydrogenase (short-subunit alcohol dehydrogenase family)|uniref:SDR family NAD(P)-dependent oxidoreductase n=1 Tax=Aeromicrobium sp. REDSEA-S38_B2 TaxID=1811528 RepID=UPI000AAD1462|nr:SDR family NAD(P)-dependent oxidoreductase [Aeromicrobium sp. REDSEA-S38_B2]
MKDNSSDTRDTDTRHTDTRATTRKVLVVGATRGLGLAVVEEYVGRGAHVVATERSDGPSGLRTLAERHREAVEVERLDVTRPEQVAALRERLRGRTFDLLLVVAGISLAPQEAVGVDIATDDFTRMMETNVLGVMRTVEGLDGLVAADGTVAVMSSGQGSVANNTSGGFEVYRATKAALNQMVRSYAVRQAGGSRSILLLAPGWVRTHMGGSGATLEVSESIPPLVDTIEAQRGRAGLRFLDRHGDDVPW